jgi:type IV secretory pathway VirB3-like protein
VFVVRAVGGTLLAWAQDVAATHRTFLHVVLRASVILPELVVKDFWRAASFSRSLARFISRATRREFRRFVFFSFAFAALRVLKC